VAENNFPQSGDFWDSTIVPSREMVVKNDAHGIEEVFGTFFTGGVDAFY
jgi:hypothetical protein